MDTIIKYFEKPITADEIKVSFLLEQIARAINTKNINLLISVHSEYASIGMLTLNGAPLTKKEYKNRMSKIITDIRSIYFSDVIIRVNIKEAFVSCTSNIIHKDNVFPLKFKRYFKCVKIAEEWKIIEAKYV